MAEKITIKKPISKFCLQTLHNVEENDYPINTIEASTWQIFVGAVQDCWEEAAQHFSDASLVVCLLDIPSFPEGGVPVLATWWTYETHRGGENSHWFDRSCPSCSIFQQYEPSWQLRCSLLTWCPFRLAFGTAYSQICKGVFSSSSSSSPWQGPLQDHCLWTPGQVPHGSHPNPLPPSEPPLPQLPPPLPSEPPSRRSRCRGLIFIFQAPAYWGKRLIDSSPWAGVWTWHYLLLWHRRWAGQTIWSCT